MRLLPPPARRRRRRSIHAGTLECNPSPSDSPRCSASAIQIADFMAAVAIPAINLSFAGPIPSILPLSVRPSIFALSLSLSS